MRYQQLLFPVVLPPGARITVHVVEPEKRPVAVIADGGTPATILEATITMDADTPPITMLSLRDADGRGRFVRRLYEKFLQTK